MATELKDEAVKALKRLGARGFYNFVVSISDEEGALRSNVDDARTLSAYISEIEAKNERLLEALEELARLGGSNGEYGNSMD